MSEHMLAQQMRRADILSNLTDEQLFKIALCADRTVFKDGDFIAKKGANSSCAVIIVDGNFSCIDGIGEGKQYAKDQSGTVIGEMAMFIEGFQHPSTFIARSRVKALLVDRETMLELMEEDQDLAQRFICKVSSRLSEITSAVGKIENMLHGHKQQYAQEAA